MPVSEPEISVVVATHNRADRLRALLEALREQTLAAGHFEVVVVDDGSRDDTPKVLADETARGALALHVIRRPTAGGPAQAREDGWRQARGRVIAFTDDDCRPEPGWLGAGLAATADDPARVVQGRTIPDPDELHLHGPFSHTIDITAAGAPWETCNIFYPRVLLEAVDGFDARGFPRSGEDTDLAWRALEAGATMGFAPDAVVRHAVTRVGVGGMLRLARRAGDGIPLFSAHPGLRRVQLHRGVFWAPTHEEVLGLLAAAVLPRRWWPVSVLLAVPYLRRHLRRRSGPVLLPWFVVRDVYEIAHVLRCAARERVLVV